MVKPRRGAHEPDWQSSDAYSYTSGLPRRGWAWEFLRRNSHYQRDCARMASMLEVTKIGAHQTVLNIPSSAPDPSCWGLLFR